MADTIIPASPAPQPEFLPMSQAGMAALGWTELDVLLVSGDAYVDHPSFGAALLGRLLVAHGLRVGIVAQPRWELPGALEDFQRLGRPRLFAGVAAGALDSQLAHYTAFRKKRSDDAYTPGGLAGARPNRAVLVYAGLVRRAFPGLPVVIGGLEASLRRLSHYDFWSDALRRSIVLDSKADLLCYGMAERSTLAVARRLDAGQPLKGIPGTAFAGTRQDVPPGAEVLELPSHEAILADRPLLMAATLSVEQQVHQGAAWAVQDSAQRTVVVAPPPSALATAELDFLHALPFARAAHPAYEAPIPAVEMIRDSITTHRGCGGGCAFCGLAMHQGRRIASRSRASILAEVATLARAGRRSISDLGGPSANMWGALCGDDSGRCRRASCLFPKPCPKLSMDHRAWLDMLRAAKAVPGVRHVRVASGVRYDLALRDPDALRAFLAEFVGGQLKVAPEHVVPEVTRRMRKPGPEVFERLLDLFCDASAQVGKEQYVVPYLMSGHPGCTDAHMEQLAAWLAKRGWKPRQVQCFIPLPGTVSAAMYFAGIDEQGQPLSTATTDAARLRQHGKLTGQTGRTDRTGAPPQTPPGGMMPPGPPQSRQPRDSSASRAAGGNEGCRGHHSPCRGPRGQRPRRGSKGRGPLGS